METCQVFSLLLSGKCFVGSGVFISLFLFYFPYCWHLTWDLWVFLRCVSQSENCISQGTSYWEVEFVLFGGTTLVTDLVGISVSGHPHPLPGWVTAKVFTPKRERMRIQGWFTNQRFRITIHTSYFRPALSTLRFWVRLACLLTPC